MTAHVVSVAKHATLGVSTVDSVTFKVEYPVLEIINRSATITDLLYVTVSYKWDPSNNPILPADPTVGGDDTYLIPAGPGHLVLESSPGARGFAAVKLISATATPFSAQCYLTRTR